MSDKDIQGKPLILAIETATRAGGVAVSRGEEALSTRNGDPAVSHSNNLIEMVEGVLSDAGINLSQVDLFAVAVGPGSFTGLRIGIATVKALAVCQDRQVAGINTLAAVAHASGATGQIVALLPAGRGEVFAQLFSSENGNVSPLDEAAHLPPGALADRYGSISDLHWAGEGAQQQTLALRDFAGARGIPFSVNGAPGWKLASGSACLAASVAVLASRDARGGSLVGPEELRAIYVRASDAEINERWQQQKERQPPVK